MRGPTEKMSSSMMLSRAKALRRRSASGAAAAQRARTMEPMAGCAAPATATTRAWTTTGRPYSTAATKPTSAIALMAPSQGRSRCWPTRSIHRLLTMAPAAAATWNAAERTPGQRVGAGAWC